MEFIDTLVALRDEYKTGSFQEEVRQDETEQLLRLTAQEEIERLRGWSCPNCGEYNHQYPEPCSRCMAEFEANEVQLIAANRAREIRCVECGVVSATYVCPSCWGK
jgi:DNA-directed RNA polymerase subunit RPC12/RpoP